jgi:oligosaccharide repeat unit polymerase
MRELRFNKRPMLLHPVVVFSFIWFAVAFLYALQLSSVLLYTPHAVIMVTSYIWIPFVSVAAVYAIFHHFTKWAYPPQPSIGKVDFDLLERRLTIGFRVWMLASLIEIVVSGGLPIVWLIRHSTKTYMDFGIASLHGLVNALIVSIAGCRFAMYLITGRRKHLRVPIFMIVWAILAVTRALMLAALLEFAVLFLSIKKVRPGTIARIVSSVLLFIFLFGFVGDLRQGSVDFRGIAQPTERYPDWLPSGVLWVYIYLTTPVNNLIYSVESVHPAANALFPNTFSNLVPTAVRTFLWGPDASPVGGDLVTEAFNVSTAYINPYQDYGFLGIVLYSMLAALACQFFWYRTSLRDLLIFAVLTQCLIFTVFSNLFFSPSEIAQVFWLFFFFMPRVRLGKTAQLLKPA